MKPKISLAEYDPNIAAQWHPTKNRGAVITAASVNFSKPNNQKCAKQFLRSPWIQEVH